MKKNIWSQIKGFLLVSGIGWLIDFSVFSVLANKLDFVVSTANKISAVPSIAFVFFVSTRKIFLNNKNKVSPLKKYAMYFLYQMILLLITSHWGQVIYDYFVANDIWGSFPFFVENLKIISKILITPLTMICNFVVMKILTERI